MCQLATMSLGEDDAAPSDDQPLVRVAVKAGNENEVWDPVFNYLDGKEKLLLDQLGPNDSFASMQTCA